MVKQHGQSAKGLRVDWTDRGKLAMDALGYMIEDLGPERLKSTTLVGSRNACSRSHGAVIRIRYLECLLMRYQRAWVWLGRP